jgi:hypothetical protein
MPRRKDPAGPASPPPIPLRSIPPTAPVSLDSEAAHALPAVPRRTVRHRDEGGLLLDQRRLLAVLAVTPDLKEAAGRAKLNYLTVKNWLAYEPAFKKAVDRLFAQTIDAGKTMLNSLVPKAAEMYDRALGAGNPVSHTVTCPECEHEFEFETSSPNWPTQLRAGEVVLKRIGDLKEHSVREIAGSIHHVSMTVEQQIALLALKGGRPITPGIRRELEGLGVIEKEEEGTEGEIDNSSAGSLLPLPSVL